MNQAEVYHPIVVGLSFGAVAAESYQIFYILSSGSYRMRSKISTHQSIPCVV